MSATDMTPSGTKGNVLQDLGADPDERTDGLSGYAVKLAIFEGPLDLLLHLIRQNEVDITDIPIQRIAEQYLETIELMQELNLDVANDAGARHVAAAFGVPSVIFFGPTSVSKTADNLARIEILETEHGCRPCYRRRCPIDHRCLTSIGVEEALAASARAFERARSVSCDLAAEAATRASVVGG